MKQKSEEEMERVGHSHFQSIVYGIYYSTILTVFVLWGEHKVHTYFLKGLTAKKLEVHPKGYGNGGLSGGAYCDYAIAAVPLHPQCADRLSHTPNTLNVHFYNQCMKKTS